MTAFFHINLTQFKVATGVFLILIAIVGLVMAMGYYCRDEGGKGNGKGDGYDE